MLTGADAAVAAQPVTFTLAGKTISATPGVARDMANPAAEGTNDSRPVVFVTMGNRTFKTLAGADSGDETVPPDVRTQVRIEDGYLLVRYWDGGNGWRGSRQTVFAIRGGALTRLGVVVDASDWWTHDFEERARRMRRRGIFLDVDDRLEENGLTSHADAPAIHIARKDAGRALVYDGMWCWSLNAAAHAAAEEAIAANGDSIAGHLSVAVIDKYCGRVSALRDDLKHARARLEPKIFAILSRDVTELRIGAPPDR